MFGLNDNEDKHQEEVKDADLTAPVIGGSLDPTQIVPASDSNGPILPTSPAFLPTEPLSPFSDPPAPPALPLASPIEAIPGPIAPQASSSPPSADATMPEDSGLNGVHLENGYIPAEPNMPSIDKKSDKKKSGGPNPTASSLMDDNSGSDELVKLKQQALESLAPLVNQLDQTPEEKFKTTMMLIQASDNAELVHEAYEAANQITDEKARAQALLDVVNEINYFTQARDSDSHSDEK